MKKYRVHCKRCGADTVVKGYNAIALAKRKHRKECRLICVEAFKARMLSAGVDVTSHVA